jgi:hypothetical protein
VGCRPTDCRSPWQCRPATVCSSRMLRQSAIRRSTAGAMLLQPVQHQVSPRQYQLERWTSDGERLLTVKVASRWFYEPSKAGRPDYENPDPRIVGIWEDPDGILWILGRVADSDWRPPPASERNAERAFDVGEYSDTHDWILDAVRIQGDSATVLATRRFPSTWSTGRQLMCFPRSALLRSSAPPSTCGWLFSNPKEEVNGNNLTDSVLRGVRSFVCDRCGRSEGHIPGCIAAGTGRGGLHHVHRTGRLSIWVARCVG